MIWIDFYCVNQHRPVAAPEMSSIADVMKGVGKVRLSAGAGGRQGVAATSATVQLGRQGMSSRAVVMKGVGKVRLVAGVGGRQGVLEPCVTAQLGRQKRAAEQMLW